MPDFPSTLCTAFDKDRLLAQGRLGDVAIVVKRAAERGAEGPLLTFDDATGAVIDLDLRGTKPEILKRLSDRNAPPAAQDADTSSGEAGGGETAARGRGRPKLGVVAREVTLLPRHWEWLGSQPGGASVALRRLVEEARRASAGQDQTRARREAAYRFMSAMAGDLAGFEEAARALFAGRQDDFEQHMASWPEDVRNYALKLAAIQKSGQEADKQ